MDRNKVFVLIIMIWITFLTTWAVNHITSALDNNDVVTVHGVPVQPIPPQISTIQMDKDTVWVIDVNQAYIKVITRDQNGYYHLKQSPLSIENQ
ncbi:hypothetical protein ACFFK0_15845 [Paenibacillus chartarius]|uniref:Uncharacterized protein n=1 Tax=Paenibacillus chartarius TaxID=747481 RepID=A0ABV6DMN0_9BACL